MKKFLMCLMVLLLCVCCTCAITEVCHCNKHEQQPTYNSANDGKATCTTPAYHIVYCSNCGGYIKDESYGVALGHTPKEGTYQEKKDATCNEEGITESYICDRCNEKIVGESIPKLDHPKKYRKPIPETFSTCTVKGRYAGYTCELCGETVEGAEKELAEHDFEITPGTPATCKLEGKEEYRKCKNCPYDEGGGKIEALGHDFSILSAVEIPATCKNLGTSAVMKCSRCGEPTGGDELSLVDHKYDEKTGLCIYCNKKQPTNDEMLYRVMEYDEELVNNDYTKGYLLDYNGVYTSFVSDVVIYIKDNYGKYDLKSDECVELEEIKHDKVASVYRIWKAKIRTDGNGKTKFACYSGKSPTGINFTIQYIDIAACFDGYTLDGKSIQLPNAKEKDLSKYLNSTHNRVTITVNGNEADSKYDENGESISIPKFDVTNEDKLLLTITPKSGAQQYSNFNFNYANSGIYRDYTIVLENGKAYMLVEGGNETVSAEEAKNEEPQPTVEPTQEPENGDGAEQELFVEGEKKDFEFWLSMNGDAVIGPKQEITVCAQNVAAEDENTDLVLRVFSEEEEPDFTTANKVPISPKPQEQESEEDEAEALPVEYSISEADLINLIDLEVVKQWQSKGKDVRMKLYAEGNREPLADIIVHEPLFRLEDENDNTTIEEFDRDHTEKFRVVTDEDASVEAVVYLLDGRSEPLADPGELHVFDVSEHRGNYSKVEIIVTKGDFTDRREYEAKLIVDPITVDHMDFHTVWIGAEPKVVVHGTREKEFTDGGKNYYFDENGIHELHFVKEELEKFVNGSDTVCFAYTDKSAVDKDGKHQWPCTIAYAAEYADMADADIRVYYYDEETFVNKNPQLKDVNEDSQIVTVQIPEVYSLELQGEQGNVRWRENGTVTVEFEMHAKYGDELIFTVSDDYDGSFEYPVTVEATASEDIVIESAKLNEVDTQSGALLPYAEKYEIELTGTAKKNRELKLNNGEPFASDDDGKWTLKTELNLQPGSNELIVSYVNSEDKGAPAVFTLEYDPKAPEFTVDQLIKGADTVFVHTDDEDIDAIIVKENDEELGRGTGEEIKLNRKPEGSITITATDKAGNCSDAKEVAVFVPTITIAPEDRFVGNKDGNKAIVKVDADYEGAEFTLYAEGKELEAAQGMNGFELGYEQLKELVVNPDETIVSITARDRFGNESESIPLTLDTRVVYEDPQWALISNKSTVFSVMSEPEAVVELYVAIQGSKNGALYAVMEAQNDATDCSSADEKYKCNISLNGGEKIYLKIKDRAGNEVTLTPGDDYAVRKSRGLMVMGFTLLFVAGLTGFIVSNRKLKRLNRKH